jgi:anti-anti-sigma factor
MGIVKAKISERVDIKGELVVMISGYLDIGNIPVLRELFEKVDEILEVKKGIKLIRIDLMGIRLLDSSVLGYLIKMERKLRDRGVYTIFINPNDDVYRTFVVTGVKEIIPIQKECKYQIGEVYFER